MLCPTTVRAAVSRYLYFGGCRATFRGAKSGRDQEWTSRSVVGTVSSREATRTLRPSASRRALHKSLLDRNAEPARCVDLEPARIGAATRALLPPRMEGTLRVTVGKHTGYGQSSGGRACSTICVRSRQKPMDVVNIDQVQPFVTKDGSEIRELLAHRNSAVRQQSLAEARLPVGASTIAHFHRRTEEIYYILVGSGRMTVGNSQREVGPGDAIAIPAGALHSICNTGTETLRFLCCCAPGYEHDDTVLTPTEQVV